MIPTAPNHGVQVDAQAIWCRRHLAVLHLDPKRVFPLACVRLFDFAVRDDRVKLACGWDPNTNRYADPALITEAIKAYSPLCCFVDGARWEQVLRESYPGKFEQAQAAMINLENMADKVLRDRQH